MTTLPMSRNHYCGEKRKAQGECQERVHIRAKVFSPSDQELRCLNLSAHEISLVLSILQVDEGQEILTVAFYKKSR